MAKDAIQSGRVPLDKYLTPQGSRMHVGTLNPIPHHNKATPWQFSVHQSIQAKKIRASTGVFKNLNLGTSSGQVINEAIISASTTSTTLFQNGTVANNIISGATISLSQWAGGTINNPVINNPAIGTPSIAAGTHNNGIFGTPAMRGGTYTNPNVAGTMLYPVNGSTAALGADGNWIFQTLSGTPVLTVRSLGTTYYWLPTGVL